MVIVAKGELLTKRITDMRKDKIKAKTPPTPDVLQEILRVLQGHASPPTNPAPPAPAPQKPPKVIGKGPCSLPGCTSLVYAKGMCTKHYHRQLRGRDVEAPSAVRNAVQLGTSVSRETYEVLIDAARKSDVSPFRAVRWIIEKWAQNERLLLTKNERSHLEIDP